jgi:hypothetical protein
MGPWTRSPTGKAWAGVEPRRLTAAMGRQQAADQAEGGDGGPRLARARTTGPLERAGPSALGRLVFRMVAKLCSDVAKPPAIVVQSGLSHAALVSHPLTEGRQSRRRGLRRTGGNAAGGR